MDERRGGAGHRGRPALRILGQDRLDAKNTSTRLLPSQGGLRIDLLDQVFHPLAVPVGGQMRPAGGRREHHGLGEDVLLTARAASLAASRVNVICLLALADDGAPAHDARDAAALADLGLPAFACTPDLFPSLMAAAIQRHDLGMWAARSGIVTARAEG